MKRYLAYLLFMIVLIAFAAPFVLPSKNGQPLLDWRNLTMGTKTPLAITQTLSTPIESRHDPVKLFRWQDKSHHWHFSQAAPTDGTPYETIFVDPDKNLVFLPSEGASPGTITSSEVSTSASPYTPAEIAQMVQEGRNAEALLRERHAQQQAELEGPPTGR